MFGKNEVSHQFLMDDGELLVHSIWHTMQGEGPDSGLPAIFVRLAKCNLRCFFCDTDFEKGSKFTVERLLAEIMDERERHPNTKLVVLTGGEPLLQNIIPFVTELNGEGFSVSIETAGTVYINGLRYLFSPDRCHHGNLLVCSPKTPQLNKDIVPLIGAYKYIIGESNRDPEDGLPDESTQIPGGYKQKLFRPPAKSKVPVYLQPMDMGNPEQNDVNMKFAVVSCLKHGYRLSLQVHKIAGLP